MISCSIYNSCWDLYTNSERNFLQELSIEGIKRKLATHASFLAVSSSLTAVELSAASDESVVGFSTFSFDSVALSSVVVDGAASSAAAAEVSSSLSELTPNNLPFSARY